eukprot:NODE_389_length_9467_cov_0.241567.p5 type:complete len:165 gc:universal NODE_389_length_9467_cov_0.241567:1090-1584(+)
MFLITMLFGLPSLSRPGSTAFARFPVTSSRLTALSPLKAHIENPVGSFQTFDPLSGRPSDPTLPELTATSTVNSNRASINHAASQITASFSGLVAEISDEINYMTLYKFSPPNDDAIDAMEKAVQDGLLNDEQVEEAKELISKHRSLKKKYSCTHLDFLNKLCF